MNLTVNIVDHLSEPTFDFGPVTEEDRQEVDIERTARDIWLNVLELVRLYPRSAAARRAMLSQMARDDLDETYRHLKWLRAAIAIDASKSQ